jgi:hypothetical protein
MGAKLPPQYYSILRLSIFAEWGLVEADTRRGAFRVEQEVSCRAFPGNDGPCPSLGEIDVKEATKRAASEALAQTLAVTAMLVIAGIVFYSR